MGRLWQTLILTRWKRLLPHVPVESLVRAPQDAYYQTIRQSSAGGESTLFVAIVLETILDSVWSRLVTDPATDQLATLFAVLHSPTAKNQKYRLIAGARVAL